jgi:hypothetical protein
LVGNRAVWPRRRPPEDHEGNLAGSRHPGHLGDICQIVLPELLDQPGNGATSRSSSPVGATSTASSSQRAAMAAAPRAAKASWNRSSSSAAVLVGMGPLVGRPEATLRGAMLEVTHKKVVTWPAVGGGAGAPDRRG